MFFQPYLYFKERGLQLPFALATVDYGSDLHWHNHLELLLGREGRYSVELMDEAFECGPNELVIINAKEPHQTKPLTRGASWDVLQVTNELLCPPSMDYANVKYFKAFLENEVAFTRKIQLVDGDPLLQIFDEFSSAYWNKDLSFELRAHAMILCLFALLFQQKHIEMTYSFAERQREMDLIQPVLRYVHTNYRNDIRLSEMTQMLYMCSARFCKLFKRVMGKTFSEYVNSVRINEAKAQLLITAEKVTVIAMNVGFDNVTYFNRVFKQHCGVTPTEYRELHQ
ncbi:AraC family transcriptional regulator [Eubacteriales bacterium OttesenSCG-928-N13]|nr:AraC family transcriptional regulator [Eubacteriales bacterium OttesenSCG-928-N13]